MQDPAKKEALGQLLARLEKEYEAEVAAAGGAAAGSSSDPHVAEGEAQQVHVTWGWVAG